MEWYGLAGIGVVAALVEVIKPVLPEKPQLYPLISVVIGAIWNTLLANVSSNPLGEAAITGVVVGLAASGLYSGVKTVRGE